jgi:hypothetical protein
MRRITVFTLSLLFIGLFAGSAYGQSAEQTDWSGGGGIQGPVTDWTDDWYQGGQIEWQGRPGEVFLEGDPIGAITESLIGTATQFSVIVGGDIDGDGDDDIVVYESDAGGDLYWYENTNGDGSNWVSRGVWSGVALTDVILADMDGMNGLDIVGIADTNYVHIWLNDGGGTSWTQVDLNASFAGGRDIKAADIDSDGDLDLFACSQVSDWYENINGDALSWDLTPHYGFGDCVAADLADFDNDNDLDIVCIRQSAGTEVLWHENIFGDGSGWDTHSGTVIDNTLPTTEILAADVDGDGDPDVIACAQAGSGPDDVYWWENIDAYNDSWGAVSYISQTDIDGVKSLRVFDPDLDGDMDVLAVGPFVNEVVWWENDGTPVPTWVEHPIDVNLTNAVAVCFGDFTSSELLDVAACREPELNWYEIVSYVPTGFLESSILDVGVTNHDWGVINFNLDLPGTTSLVVEVRSSNDSANMGSWTSADDGQDLSNYVTDGEQYFQYQLSLLTTNQHETPIFYDIVINWANPNAPVFDPSHSYLLTLEYNQTNTITCGLTGQPADSITLYYLPGGDMGSWSTASMTDDGGGLSWSYDLPWDERFISGLEYGFYAENADGSTWYPNGMPDSTYGIAAVTHFGEFTFPFALPPGNDVGDYRLISTPFNFVGSGNPDAQFLDELGSYDPANWRLFLWDNSSDDYVEFNPDTDNFDLQAGDAWWIITKDGLSELTFTELESVITGSDFGIQIYAGWNLFGSPYLFNVNWADCYTNIDANVEQPLTWMAGDYATATELTSMVGYWLWADADDTLYIPPYAVVGVARQPDSTTLTAPQPAGRVGDRSLPELRLPEVALSAESTTPLRSSLLTAEAVADAGWGNADSWRLAFRLENAVGGDSLHHLGVDPLAGNYDDSLERHDPPSLTGRPNLYFNHEDWPHGGGLYSTDLREPYSEGANWQFYLDGEDTAMLSWVVENGWCAGFIAVLETPAGRRVDLLDDDSVSLTAAELSSNLPCRVFVGTKDYVEGELTGTPRLSLAQSYPNPATSLTRIEYALPTAGEVSLTVYDLAGRRVATLVSGEQAAGRHAVGWEVADIPSGVYLYRLETTEGTLTRRAVISR